MPSSIVGVDLKAKGWYFLRKILPHNDLKLHYHIPLDSEYFKLTTYTLQGDIDSLLEGKNVTIVHLYFDGFQVKLEEQVVKRLPIVIPHLIDFAPEYDFAEPIILTPDSIDVSGPISELESLQEWKTDSLVLKNVSKDFKGKLALILSSNGLKFNPHFTQVEVKVERYTQKDIIVPITIDTAFSDSIRFFPDQIKLKCIVGLGHYNDLKSSDFVIMADLNEELISSGKSIATVDLVQKPDYLRSVQYSPKVVEFFLIE